MWPIVDVDLHQHPVDAAIRHNLRQAVPAAGTGTKLSFLAADHHGTSSIALDATTYAITKRYTTPFGAPRGQKPQAWPDDKSFLGKPADTTTGLTHIGAREYDPALGQFLSVDPVLTPDQAQSLNGYSYANQNPATASDPTGLCVDPGNGHCMPTNGGDAGKNAPPENHYPRGSSNGTGRSSGSGTAQSSSTGELINSSEANKRHNEAQRVAIEYLRLTNPGATVQAEYEILGAGKNGATDGSADIVMLKDGVLYIWEVKSGRRGKDEKVAAAEVAHYVKMERILQTGPGGQHLQVKAGFDIPQLVTPDVVQKDRVLVTVSTNKKRADLVGKGKHDGAISWWTRRSSGPKDPSLKPYPRTVPARVWDWDPSPSAVKNIKKGIAYGTATAAGIALTILAGGAATP